MRDGSPTSRYVVVRVAPNPLVGKREEKTRAKMIRMVCVLSEAAVALFVVGARVSHVWVMEWPLHLHYKCSRLDTE